MTYFSWAGLALGLGLPYGLISLSLLGVLLAEWLEGRRR